METIVQQASTQGDICVREVPKFLSKEEMKYFSRLSDWRFFASILTEIATIALTIGVSEKYWNPFLYVIAVIIMGSRLHALAVLMHEAAHYRGFSNRRINDIAGEMLAFPLTITMEGYRNNHFAHHRELNSADDPDWARKLNAVEFKFPKSRRAIMVQLLQFMSGSKTYAMIKKTHGDKRVKQISPRLKRFRLIFFIVLVLSSMAFGFWKLLLLYWVIPLLTTFGFFEHIRSVAEHFAVRYDHVLNHTRTVVAPFWERWLFAPYNINYHLEHHLYPGVPFFRLPELHSFLKKKEEYIKYAHITNGYTTGLFHECSVGLT